MRSKGLIGVNAGKNKATEQAQDDYRAGTEGNTTSTVWQTPDHRHSLICTLTLTMVTASPHPCHYVLI